MKDQDVVQTLSPNTPQKAFTDRIGSRRVIWCFKYLDATCGCYSRETGSELTIIIANEIFRRLSIGSRLPQLLCSPSVGRRACHTDVDDFPRFQFNEEKRKERTKEEVGDLEKIAGPNISSVIMEESRPLLPSWSMQANLPHVFLDRSFAHANIQLEQLASNALSSEDADYS
jgi:hypothetical protein